ncbi:Rieske (2Fe-2S) protein [Nocardia sp. NBC_00416]|uniref:Rieske (2Fe-2S) protein n=1 Tax=Nocardia sp. NBC_00416 TaxID=2975991 RepID=UPI002E1DF7D5
MAEGIETPGTGGPMPENPAAGTGARAVNTGLRGAGAGEPVRLAQGREHVVATVDEIPPGSSKVVPIGRHGVGVYNVNGTFYAIANYCPHEGGPLCAGRTRGRTVVDDSVPGDSVMVRDNEFIYCPWHQWGFELATGTTAVKPEWSIRTYPVRVVGDDVLVTA